MTARALQVDLMLRWYHDNLGAKPPSPLEYYSGLSDIRRNFGWWVCAEMGAPPSTHWNWDVSQFPDLRLASICFVAVAVLGLLLYREYGPHGLSHIPAVGGPPVPILSYFNAFRYFLYVRTTLHEGCNKYANGMFRVPQTDRWVVILTSKSVIDEVRQLPEDKMSVPHGVGEITAAKYVFGTGHKFLTSDDGVAILHRFLGRRLWDRAAVVHEEMLMAVKDVISSDSHKGWVGVPGFDTIVHIIARSTNRAFVGLPLCRNAEFLDVVVSAALDVFKARLIINLFPPFIKPYVAHLVSPTPRNIKKCKHFLQPIMEDRMRDGKLGRALSTIDDIISALFVLEFGSIHTTASSFTHALYEVAAHPEYAALLREEAESVLLEEGSLSTKAALGKLVRVDSFLKESQRFHGVNANSLFRQARMDVILSDGTFFPKGTVLSAAARYIHHSEENYTHPDIFDPLRFVRLARESSSVVGQNYSTPRLEYLPFGIGKHACPGRFFASLEMKMLMAHLVMTFDIQFENGGPRAQDTWLGTTNIPNRTAKLYFKERL
ncbi:cytochrome P450 monooxygenase, partial [Cristinia sonorae]